MNIWNGIGNIGKEPMFFTTESGRAGLKFSIAVDRRVRVGTDSNGNPKFEKRPDWIPVVVFGTAAENCRKYLQKGSKVAVSGALRPRSYPNKNGAMNLTFDVDTSVQGGFVQFLDKIRSPHATETSDEVLTSPTELST